MTNWGSRMTVSRSLVIATTLVTTIAVTGCDINRVERTETFEATYELLKVNPPKHFYIDVRNVETGEIHENKYISKRCNKYREGAVVGKEYTLSVDRRYFTDGTTDLRFTGARKTFCGY